jgi:tetracycline resistance efflux pump
MDPHPFGPLSLLPPVLAIVMAMATRQVVPSLLAGIWIGWVIDAGWNPVGGTAAAIAAIVQVFAEPGQTRVIVFTMLMGSLLMLMQVGGGIDGFLDWVSRFRWSATRRGARLMAWLIGLGVFIESTITCLVVGTVSRPLFDRLKISREKLAYLCDSTSAPVCILIPFNGWGAMVLGLLTTQAALGNLDGRGPLAIFVAAIPLNFYALLAVLLAFVASATEWDIGPMKAAERRAREEGKVLGDNARPVVDASVIGVPRKPGTPARLQHMAVPLVGMVAMVVAGIALTGIAGVREAELADAGLMDYLDRASGSTAVLWGVLAGLALAGALLVARRAISPQEFVDLSFRGAGGMLPLATLLVLAFGIGMTANALGTGPWVADQVRPYLTPGLVAPLVFVVTCFIAFSTGTSWGTFAIMMPLALPLVAGYRAEGLDVSIPLVVSAVLGGGIFGDHCSPISDTTVVSSMAAASDHIDHVRTQLPYALAAGAGALVLYLMAGLLP